MAVTNLNAFLKKNKKVVENIKYAASDNFVDEAGKPVEWEIRKITTAENERLQEQCTSEVQVKGKPNLYRNKLDNLTYVKKFCVACTVYPDLYNAELQDSYEVKTPEDLLTAMLDDVNDYNNYLIKCQEHNGLMDDFQDEVEEAKN